MLKYFDGFLIFLLNANVKCNFIVPKFFGVNVVKTMLEQFMNHYTIPTFSKLFLGFYPTT
jgi:hypothetical protein